jgi:peptidyl-prolyl cis-trans isomerase A (cyclophilin A)
MRNLKIGAAILAGLLVALYPAAPARGADTAPATGAAAAPAGSPLMDAKSPEMTKPAPEIYRAKFETSKGPFVIEVTRKWSPNGADRFYNLVGNGYFDGDRFFRVISGFMVQFGINGDPKLNEVWREANIPDDQPTGADKQSNTRGMVSFAKTGAPNSRSTQLFINFGDNSRLDGMGFTPIGKVVEGMAVVDSLYSGYGEGAPRGAGPDQMQIQTEGNKYLDASFPKMDFIKKASIVEMKPKAAKAAK